MSRHRKPGTPPMCPPGGLHLGPVVFMPGEGSRCASCGGGFSLTLVNSVRHNLTIVAGGVA